MEFQKNNATLADMENLLIATAQLLRRGCNVSYTMYAIDDLDVIFQLKYITVDEEYPRKEMLDISVMVQDDKFLLRAVTEDTMDAGQVFYHAAPGFFANTMYPGEVSGDGAALLVKAENLQSVLLHILMVQK